MLQKLGQFGIDALTLIDIENKLEVESPDFLENATMRVMSIINKNFTNAEISILEIEQTLKEFYLL